MRTIRKFVIPEFVFGDGAIELLGRYAINFGAIRVFVVTDEGVRQTGLLDRVDHTLRQAGVEPVVYDSVSVNPRSMLNTTVTVPSFCSDIASTLPTSTPAMRTKLPPLSPDTFMNTAV